MRKPGLKEIIEAIGEYDCTEAMTIVKAALEQANKELIHRVGQGTIYWSDIHPNWTLSYSVVKRDGRGTDARRSEKVPAYTGPVNGRGSAHPGADFPRNDTEPLYAEFKQQGIYYVRVCRSADP